MAHAVQSARSAAAGAVVVTLVAFGLTGCGHSAGSSLGHLNFTGQVSLTAAHGTTHQATRGAVLHAGDRVEVAVGEATVDLAPKGVLRLRGGTVLVVQKTPLLRVGAVLVQPAGTAVRIGAERATLLVPSGVAQLAVSTTTANLTAKVYEATSQLDIPGNPTVSIAAPRQVDLTPATHLPVAPVPVQYQDSDEWDHLYLSTAMTIATQLGAAVTGFDAQLAAGQGRDPSFYQQLLPVLSGHLDFAAALASAQKEQPTGTAPAAKAGDYLIATVIALRGAHGTLATRLSDELAFSAAGANWSFVAYDQGVTDLNGVLADMLAAIGRASLPFTGAPASQIAIGPPTRPTTTTTIAPLRPRSSPTTNPPTRSSRATTTTATTVPPVINVPAPTLPDILGSLLGPVLDPLLQVINNILAGRQ